MNKITLDTFIQKYNLGGSINSVKWESNGDTLSTRFISPDKSLLGELSLSKQSLPNFEVGVYDTPLLSKMLGTLADKVDFNVIKSPVDETQPVAFGFSDGKISISSQEGVGTIVAIRLPQDGMVVTERSQNV